MACADCRFYQVYDLTENYGPGNVWNMCTWNPPYARPYWILPLYQQNDNGIHNPNAVREPTDGEGCPTYEAA